MSIVIKVENLSKQYRLGNIGLGTISHDINRWWYNVRGKEDPYLKIGEENNRSKKGISEYVWALRDINFEVKQGEVLGIIGRNGAGKSTLLKILSRTTTPTTGQVKIKGRVASLLEVGTGFHPELTGRENVFLNGAILGMTKQEIKSKFDEIVDFAGVEKYIDTPVKRYSSGMHVRLAFGVAAHLDPEILIVDEVLAVGDAEFQKKALGKMKDVSNKDGRTVLFVSHNMGAIKSLCNSAILLNHGTINFEGDLYSVIDNYLVSSEREVHANIENNINRSGTQNVKFADFYFENKNGETVNHLLTGEDIVFVFVIKVANKKIQKVNIGFSIHDMYGDPLTVLYSGYQNVLFNNFKEGYNHIRLKIKNFSISPGKLYIKGRIEENGLESDWYKDNLGIINIEMGDFYQTGNVGATNWNSKFLIKGEWDFIQTSGNGE